MTGNDQNRPSQWRISTTANSPLVRNCRSPPPTGTIATWGKFRPDSCLESFDWESFKLIKLKPHFPQTSFEAGLDKLRCLLTLALSLAHSVTVTLAHPSSLWLSLAISRQGPRFSIRMIIWIFCCGFSSNWILHYFPLFVCPCVIGVTSHISHIYKGINAMLIIMGPIKPYKFWIKIILAIFLENT